MSLDNYAKSLLTEITGPGEEVLGIDDGSRTEETEIKADRAEAESDLAEAMRITNSAIRRVHKLGLTVEASFLTLHSPGGQVPQVNFGTVRSLINDDPSS
jgi:hypothetical protein